MSDVKLDGVKVILESEGWVGGKLILDGPLLKAQTWDLWLYHPARLKAGTPPDAARRAMVHTSDDGVGINVNRDYPGGVTIGGEVTLQDKLTASRDVNLNGKLTATAGATINGDVNLGGPLTANAGATINGDLTLNILATAGAHINGDVNLNGKLTATAGATINGDVNLNGKLISLKLFPPMPDPMNNIFITEIISISEATIKYIYDKRERQGVSPSAGWKTDHFELDLIKEIMGLKDQVNALTKEIEELKKPH
jgi:hypothetical protein